MISFTLHSEDKIDSGALVGQTPALGAPYSWNHAAYF